MTQLVLDSHSHCGYTVPFAELAQEWRYGDIQGGAVFSPVEEIYDRYDPFFTDSPQYQVSRTRVHRYLLELGSRKYIFPYFFVWNDFAPIPDGFVGIKWHRHAREPAYRYDSPRCDAIIDEICARQLPVVLEEEFGNTLQFVDCIGGRTVTIIPHMGGLNGGYARLRDAGVFEHTNIWADTALASRGEIKDYADRYGPERLLFGSDYPFGTPYHEKKKLTELFSGSDLDAILAGNLLRLLGKTAEDSRDVW
jgi:hypothetical protein